MRGAWEYICSRTISPIALSCAAETAPETLSPSSGNIISLEDTSWENALCTKMKVQIM